MKIVFDTEVFRNYFCAVFFDTVNKKILVWEKAKRNVPYTSKQYKCNDKKYPVVYSNDIKLLLKISKYELIGYNNHNYDDVMLNAALKGAGNLELYKLSKSIINGTIDWKSKRNSLNTIDLMSMLASSKLRVSLKHLQVTTKWYNVEDFECDWDAELPETEFNSCIDYCINDVLSTNHIVKLKAKDFELREKVLDRYSLDCRSKDGVKLGIEILSDLTAKSMDIPLKQFKLKDNEEKVIKVLNVCDLIEPFISFKRPEMKALLSYMNKAIIDPGKDEKDSYFSYRLIYNNTIYDIGAGGLHAFSEGEILKPRESELLYQSDVGSYYPSQKIKLKYAHRLDPHFNKAYTTTYDGRNEAKRIGDKVEDATFKLSNNGVYGNYNNKYSAFYSPETAFKICINGQLMLLMLVEWLEEAEYNVVGANTDCVEVFVPKDKKEEYIAICTKWEELTKMTLDHEAFTAIYRLSCNHYIGLYADDEGNQLYDKTSNKPYFKEKGSMVVYPDIIKGFSYPVVAIAVQKYFIENIPIEKTIRSHVNTDMYAILDYCMTIKCGKDYKMMWGEDKQQKTNRYYASRAGKYLFKVKGSKVSNVLADSPVIMANKITANTIINKAEINYPFYTNKARKLITQIEGTGQLDLFKQ